MEDWIRVLQVSLSGSWLMYRGSNVTPVNVRGIVCIICAFLNYFYDIDPLRPIYCNIWPSHQNSLFCLHFGHVSQIHKSPHIRLSSTGYSPTEDLTSPPPFWSAEKGWGWIFIGIIELLYFSYLNTSEFMTRHENNLLRVTEILKDLIVGQWWTDIVIEDRWDILQLPLASQLSLAG